MVIDPLVRPRFANEGAGILQVPDGWHVRPDRALAALETAGKHVLQLPMRVFDGPRFALADKPVRPSSSPLTDSSTVSYAIGLPNPESLPWYDATPSRTKKQVTQDALNNGNPESILNNIFENDSLGAAPPRGPSLVMGKDRGYRTRKASPIEVGPFCTTMFADYEHFIQMLQALEVAAPKAVLNALEYEKIRNFITMSHHNFACVAGTRTGRPGQHMFIDNVDSPGTLDWVMSNIELAAVHFPYNEEIKVKCSSRILEYWVRAHARKYSTTLNVDFQDLRGTIGGYSMSWTTSGFTVMSKRLNRRITFITEGYTPIYVTTQALSSSAAEFQFQGFWRTRAGDDTRDGEANGVIVEPNPYYGVAFPNTDRNDRLRELILFYSDSAFHYEAFPSNPLSGQFPGSELSTDLQALWGSAKLNWYFGSEVQQYWLDRYRDVPGLQGLSNIDRTWFAARVWAGMVAREDNKRAMGSLLVSVPYDDVACEADNVCPPDVFPAAITLTAATPDSGVVADLNPTVPADTQSYLRPQYEATFVANDSVDKIGRIWVRRENGLLSFTDDAIRDGWIPNASWDSTSGFLSDVTGPLGDQYQEEIVITYAAKQSGSPAADVGNLVQDTAGALDASNDYQFVKYTGTDGDYTNPANFTVCETADRELTFPKADAAYSDGDASPFLQCIFIKIQGKTIDPDVAEELVGDANELARRWTTIAWTQTDPTPAGASTYNMINAAGAAAGSGETTLAVLFPTAEV